MAYQKLGIIFIVLAFILGFSLIIFPTILNPDSLLMVEATTLYRNVVIIVMVNWVFVMGLVFLHKDK